MKDENDGVTQEIQLKSYIGYARISTADQNLDLQLEALKNFGCIKIFTDVASGAKAERPGLDDALNYLREGDTLVVWKLDRLGRSLSHLLQIIDSLSQRHIHFKSITDSAIDTTTSSGQLMLTMIAALSEFERNLIRERTKEGLAVAKARGRKGGRRPVITDQKLKKAKQLIDKGLTVREAASAIGVGKSSLYESLKKFNF
ncbi:DNA-invertase from lambdoid prophage e14 [Wohlfahrtiimonas chitiniclastica SH04]|uniref:DNA-invertase from lambdoid prophage e14 n=1 Tax=Wohlfahrtiimonas chitiniclastica SH04 TaxID=1261130 RepID=L8XTK1_9GAMM|nr:recombinase family protein [Wohlfahrtiimonas chitiniclastica]ELV07232.1 DNA-invertase from lambdoid prophage e14 [Wohlfahrtiimonas chitiniclastica SH04]